MRWRLRWSDLLGVGYFRGPSGLALKGSTAYVYV